MTAEIIHMRALVRLPTQRDRRVRLWVDTDLGDLIGRFVRPHLRPDESVDVLKEGGNGVRIEITSSALQDAWRRLAKDRRSWNTDDDDDGFRLDRILAALAQFERACRASLVSVQAVALHRRPPQAVSEACWDAVQEIWRGVLAERVSEDAWLAAMGRQKRLRHALTRWPVDEARALAHAAQIVERAFACPPPPRPLSPPGPDDVTLPEIMDAYRKAAAGDALIRLVSDKPWRDLFHEQDDIRIGALTLTLSKRDHGARGTVAARHDDGRASDFERLRAMGPDPLHVIDAQSFERLCDLLEALEPESGT
jgi:hypothetical protein